LGEITELHVGLKGTMNALFLKDLADKTRRGLRGRIEKWRSGGGVLWLRNRPQHERRARRSRNHRSRGHGGPGGKAWPRRPFLVRHDDPRTCPPREQASSTTNSTSASFYGIDCAIARIQRRDGGFRAPAPNAHTNNNPWINQATGLYGGVIPVPGGGLVAFIQVTWDEASQHVALDQSDIRYVQNTQFLDYDVTWGIDIDNAPSIEDSWNTTY
jgi:hypothetical protein